MVTSTQRRGLAVFGDVGDQRVAGGVELAGAVGFEREQGAEARGVRRRQQLGGGEAELGQVLFRKINRGPCRRLPSRRE